MLSTLNNLASQKELQIFVTKNVFLDKKLKTQQQQKKKIKHKNTCRSRELNPGFLAPKVALCQHTVKIKRVEVGLKQAYLATRWIEYDCN